tara:strand:- start:198 stop:392 length:195 start_codon:yes stop_codon:yes gene_type:complete
MSKKETAKAKMSPLSKEEARSLRYRIDSALKHVVITRQPEELHYIIPESVLSLIMATLDRSLSK